MAEYTTRGFGAGQVLFSIAGADWQRAFQEGRFESAGMRALAAENHRIAEVTQSYVTRFISNNLVRRGVSTGRLLRATADPKNVYASAFYIGVGNPSFLDRSMAKYWRTIEEGSAATWKKRAFTSLELVGVFGETMAGRYAGPKFTLPNHSAPRGKFRPVRPDSETGIATWGRIQLRSFSPRHEIAPMHAYRDAYQSGRFRQEGIAAARKYLDSVLGTDVVVAGTGFLPPGAQ